MRFLDFLGALSLAKKPTRENAEKKAVSKFSGLLVERFKSPLKAAGFKKSGQTWHKCDGEVSLVVNIQQSRWNNWAYVNCGVYVDQPKTGKVPKVYECHLRFRLEDVTPGALGRLVEGENHDLLSSSPRLPDSIDADAFADALVRFGIPFLSKFETKDKIRGLIATRDQGSSDPACLFTHQLTGKFDT